MPHFAVHNRQRPNLIQPRQITKTAQKLASAIMEISKTRYALPHKVPAAADQVLHPGKKVSVWHEKIHEQHNGIMGRTIQYIYNRL